MSLPGVINAKAKGPADPIRAAVEANARLFAVCFAFAAAMSILALTVSFYMLEVYDRVLNSRSISTLVLLTIIAAGGVAVYSALDSLRLRLLIRIGMRVANQLTGQVLRSMIALSAQAGGSVARQGLRDIDSIRNFIGSPGLAALIDAPFLLVFLFVLFMLHWAYFILVLVGGAIIVGIAFLDQFLTSRTLTSSIGATIRAHQFAEDGLRNADLLEGMGISSTFVTRWRDQWVESLRLSLQSSDKDSILSGFSRGVRQFIQVALLGTGALLVLKYHASSGVMIAASIIGGRALAPIETMVSTWKSITAARLAAGRVREIMRRAPKRDEGMPLPAPLGRINVERVSYAPPGGKKAIVAGVSFALDAGDSCGVIGPSASGKSSLMRLLVGAWPAMSGVVRLDGADIYGWPRAELSPYIGYLPQDVELFGGTVRENIARLTEGDPELVVAAAKLAGAHEMILQLANGYDTDIGESGAKLSGGQRQRIGIARSLYGDPRFVVLDEPNSNLDAAGEEALLQTLMELKRRNVTVVIVAHRPSILGAVDKMLAMRDGAVEAFGPRNDVIQKYTPRGPAPRPTVVPLQASAPGQAPAVEPAK
ncbi:MAG TPA: type I secretion system permease/ATPase [Rhizomicrobium sp.]|jgi:PrtD family type I secretion system ABC transporter|nr:type I secretion system permease/ATPase [Rhizomicrobium sp.]